MRIIVPFAGQLHPITERSLEELAPHAERVDVGGDDYAYSRLFTQLWRDGESFLIIEHDIEPNRVALEDIERCGCQWGLSAYPIDIGIGRAALGFTRFSAEVLWRFPDLMDRAFAGEFTPKGWDQRLWSQMDYAVYCALTAEGVHWHHHPIVGHHHWRPAAKRCTCGSPRETICPSRRHHLGDIGCDCLREVPTSDSTWGAARRAQDEAEAAANLAAGAKAREEEERTRRERLEEADRRGPFYGGQQRASEAAVHHAAYPGAYNPTGTLREPGRPPPTDWRPR